MLNLPGGKMAIFTKAENKTVSDMTFYFGLTIGKQQSGFSLGHRKRYNFQEWFKTINFDEARWN